MTLDERLRVELHADLVRVEVALREPFVAGFHGIEDVHLKLHLVVVWIAVVHGEREAVVDAPIGLDAQPRQAFVGGEEIVQGAVGIGAVVHPGGAGGAILQAGHVDDGDAVMLVIKGEEGEHRRGRHHLRLQHLAMPLDHLGIARRAIDDVRELRGGDLAALSGGWGNG